MLLVSYVCSYAYVHVFFFPVEPADESCHIKKKGRNQFYRSRQFILLVLPNVYTNPMHRGWSLDFELIEYVASSQHASSARI